MNQDLASYLKIYPVFDDKFCAQTVKELNEVAWGSHSYHYASSNSYQTFKDDLKTSYDAVSTKDAIMDGIWHSLLRYYQELAFPWLDGWMGFTDIRFNKYEEGTRMRVHCDHIHSMFDGERKGIPTITVLGALNDDYEGGELLFWESKKIELPAGSLAIFPSNFLYPHEVLPVTKGVRHSFVSWAW